jgi:phage tail-like protein
MAILNAVGIRSDPVLNHNFIVSLIDTSSNLGLLKSISSSAVSDIALGGFMECSGLEMSLEVKDFEEGGNNGFVHRFPTRMKWSNIVLKKGLGIGTALWDWHYSFVEGKGRRRDGMISLLNDRKVPTVVWYFRNGLPVKYTGPSLNATQNNVAIESIEIAHEGIYQITPTGLLANAAQAAKGGNGNLGF